jgi:trehalose 6-phosphate phosphatase
MMAIPINRRTPASPAPAPSPASAPASAPAATSASSPNPAPARERAGVPALPENAALFLDLDGTLAPIVRRPELARVPRETVEAVRALHQRLNGAIAIISGRPIAQIDVLLGPLRLPAAGVHGAQRRDAKGRMYKVILEPPVNLRRVIVDLVARFPNVWLEHKPAALTLHYRAAPDAGPSCGRALSEALQDHPEWTLLGGKCVWEIKPRAASKSGAVEAFLREPPFTDRVPVFCGDDETDEDGFLAARAHGGWGVKVDGLHGAPSVADHHVDTTAAFMRYLIQWAKGAA